MVKINNTAKVSTLSIKFISEKPEEKPACAYAFRQVNRRVSPFQHT